MYMHTVKLPQKESIYILHVVFNRCV